MKKGKWTEEEKKEYFEKVGLLQNKFKEIIDKQCDLLKNESLNNNFVESFQKYKELQKEFDSICVRRKKIDNDFGIYY